MQRDGNVVLYPKVGRATWSTGTRNATSLRLGTYGNLVALTATGRPVFQPATTTLVKGPVGFADSFEQTILLLQDDGNLVLYGQATGRPLWSSRSGKVGT